MSADATSTRHLGDGGHRGRSRMSEVVRITFPEPDPEIGRRRIEVVPEDRDAFAMWRDQFGTVHGAAFGLWADVIEDIEAVVLPMLL